VLPVAFKAVFTSSRLSFYEQLLKQLNIASLSCPVVFLLCYSLLPLYVGQINDDDYNYDYDYGDEDDNSARSRLYDNFVVAFMRIKLVMHWQITIYLK